LRVFENRVLRRIFGPKMEELNEEMADLGYDIPLEFVLYTGNPIL